uniref:Uncharacterized protein n=1 Tax=Helianthus annuus TaxID=4232 RepID=A0A251VE34_HELAN
MLITEPNRQHKSLTLQLLNQRDCITFPVSLFVRTSHYAYSQPQAINNNNRTLSAGDHLILSPANRRVTTHQPEYRLRSLIALNGWIWEPGTKDEESGGCRRFNRVCIRCIFLHHESCWWFR